MTFVPYGMIGALGIFALAVPLVSIAPRYAPPTPLDHLPDSAQQVEARFGGVKLIGYETPDGRYQPGDTVPVTVYWQVIEPSEQDNSLFLTLLNDHQEAIGKIDTYPGGGRLRTTTWQPGAIYADAYQIPIDEAVTGRFSLRMQVGWWNYPNEEIIPAMNGDGQPLEAVILDVGGFADPKTEVELLDMTATPSVDFGSMIRLRGYQIEDNVIRLAWESIGTPDDDYTVFVQILDDAGEIIGQGDAPPALPTHYWRSGERYVTEHLLYYATPPMSGIYPVVIGWYRAGDFARLGADYPDSAYPLTTITIP